MIRTSAFCLAQEAVQRDRAATANLKNVQMIATSAAAVWAREAASALRREAKLGREDRLPAAASLSEIKEDLWFSEKSRPRVGELMVLRTTRSSVTFGFPFRLEAFDELLPAGSYDIDTEEEGIEGNERTVYVRVATLLHVRTTGRVQTITVASKDLQRAIDADKIQSGLEAN